MGLVNEGSRQRGYPLDKINEGGWVWHLLEVGIPSILLQRPTTYMTTPTVDTRIQSTYHARPAKYHARHTMVPAQSHRSAVSLMLDKVKEKYSIARTYVYYYREMPEHMDMLS